MNCKQNIVPHLWHRPSQFGSVGSALLCYQHARNLRQDTGRGKDPDIPWQNLCRYDSFAVASDEEFIAPRQYYDTLVHPSREQPYFQLLTGTVFLFDENSPAIFEHDSNWP